MEYLILVHGHDDEGDCELSVDSVPELRITRLVLVNADTNHDIRYLDEDVYETINLAVDGPHLAERADVTGPVKFVKVETNYENDRVIENIPPFVYPGDNTKGDYYSWTPIAGYYYRFEVTPYDQKNAQGEAGVKD